MKRITTAALTTTLLLAAVSQPNPAGADVPRPAGGQLNIVHLGDSYSAGNGAGKYHGPVPCMRSSNNWGQRFANTLSGLGIKNTYQNRACSGGKIQDLFRPRQVEMPDRKRITAISLEDARRKLAEGDACGVQLATDVTAYDYDLRPASGPSDRVYTYQCSYTLQPQADGVDETTDVVLLTMGGNDADFDNIVNYCFSPGIPFIHAGINGPECKKAVESAERELADIMKRLEQGISTLFSKNMDKNPSSQVVLSSYPLLALDVERRVPLDNGESYDAAREVRRLGLLAVEHQRGVVQRLNQKFPGRVKLIETPVEAFAGHEPDPRHMRTNDDRWLNQMFETEGDYGGDGKITAPRTVEKVNFWHPNTAGHREWGKLIEVSGVSPDAPLIGDRNEAMDVVLVLDATSSMQNRWASTVQAIKSAMLLFHEIDVRFALVTYQDHPTGGGVPGNYPARLHQDFTADPEVFRQALDSVELAPAGDPPEAVYSGIMTALNLSTWRANSSKTVLVVGDGPAKDPEPVTGYTWAQIRNRACSASTPQVSILGDAELTDNPALVQLATETGGNITTQPEDTDPADAITQELEQLSAAPVAWLQGP